jgi:peptidyl-tRNA hydrolase
LEYYKFKYDGEYRIVIPYNFSRSTGEYLAQVSGEYNFYSEEEFICHDKMKIFDMRCPQPEINVYKARI